MPSARQPFLYLAGPITKGDRLDNFTIPTRLWKLLMSKGVYSFVPQHSMLIEYLVGVSYEEWLNLDFQVIHRCDGLVRLKGESAGADREVRLALELGLPVYYQHDFELATFAGLVASWAHTNFGMPDHDLSGTTQPVPDSGRPDFPLRQDGSALPS